MSQLYKLYMVMHDYSENYRKGKYQTVKMWLLLSVRGFKKTYDQKWNTIFYLLNGFKVVLLNECLAIPISWWILVEVLLIQLL